MPFICGAGVARCAWCAGAERCAPGQVTDAGVAHMTALLQLRTLVLDCCHVTNGGVACLARLTALTRLDLSDNAVTSSAVAALAPLSALTALNLFSTGVSDAGPPPPPSVLIGHVSSLLPY